MAFRAIVPPCMLRSNVCKDVQVVGMVSTRKRTRKRTRVNVVNVHS